MKLNNNLGPICCSGTQSCYGATNITGTMDESSNVSIRCDGKDSCGAGSNYVLSKQENGNIYSTGMTSILSSIQTIVTKDDVFCTAHSSCYYVNIKNSNNLYCMAWLSCGFASIFKVNNVFGYVWSFFFVC